MINIPFLIHFESLFLRVFWLLCTFSSSFGYFSLFSHFLVAFWLLFGHFFTNSWSIHSSLSLVTTYLQNHIFSPIKFEPKFQNVFLQKFHNATACQLLGNLCSLTLHTGSHPSCAVLHNLIFLQRYHEVPHVFYESGTTQVPIKNEEISTVFKLRQSDIDSEPRSHRLNITYVSWKLDGNLENIGTVEGSMFQMCNGSFQEFDAAFNFGTRYLKKCQIPAHIFFKFAPNPTFYDLYIPYEVECVTF